MVDKLLAGVDARLTKLETEIRATPRRGAVLLSTGRSVGWERLLSASEWARIDADWRAVSGFSEPVPIVEDEAVAA